MPPRKVELVFLHGISLDFALFHVYMQRYSFSPFNNAVRCIIQEAGKQVFSKAFWLHMSLISDVPRNTEERKWTRMICKAHLATDTQGIGCSCWARGCKCLTAPSWHRPSLFRGWNPLPIILNLSQMYPVHIWGKRVRPQGQLALLGRTVCLGASTASG